MLKNILPVSIIVSLRFLGLFIVLPVLSAYAMELKNANEILVGMTLGVYAVSQIIMQTPLGYLSDKIGRKKVLFAGTIIFIAGSLMCAYSNSIYALFLGRFIQGLGAVGAVGAALISDMTKENERAKAMAFMGIIIAFSFVFSIIFGSVIGGNFGVDKLFLFTAFLGFLSLFLLLKIPNPPIVKTSSFSIKVSYKQLLTDKSLYKINITNFLQKMLMTTAFLTIPLVLVREFLWEKSELWIVYAPAAICGILAMLPSVVIGEKMKKSKLMLCIGILFLGVSYLFLGYAKSSVLFVAGVALFFIGFNIHEPLLQSIASKYAKVNQRGVTLGIFNAFGYFGTFFGGVLGGLLLKNYGIKPLSLAVFCLCLAWLLLIIRLKNPAFFQNIHLELNNKDYKTQNLNNAKGIMEWYATDNTLVVKFDSREISKDEILGIIN